MLKDTNATPAEVDGGPQESASARAAAMGPTTVRLLQALAEGDVLAVVAGEQRAEAIARATRSLSGDLVLFLPAPDALPGESGPSSPRTAGRRYAALAELAARDTGRRVLLVTHTSAAAQLLPPSEAFASGHRLALGDEIDPEALSALLEGAGYLRDDRVDEPGEFAVRGATVDLFPADAERPVRVHLDEGRIEEIIPFDPVSQLGNGEPLERLVFYPAAEPDWSGALVPVFAHLPGAQVALDPEVTKRRDSFIALAREGSKNGGERIADSRIWDTALRDRTLLDLSQADEQPVPRFVEQRRPERGLLTFIRESRGAGRKVVLTGTSRDLRFIARRAEQRLSEAPLTATSWADVVTAAPGTLLAAVAEFDRGWSGGDVSVIAAADVLGARAGDLRAATSADPLSLEVADFHVGDAVIHEDHGLAVLRGLEPFDAAGAAGEAIRLEHAKEDQRLLPVVEAGRLWRYGAEAEAVTLDRLDGSSWQKRRAEIDEALAETARELIRLAEARATRTAPVLDPPVAAYERFAAGFPYTETPDQLRAIDAARSDLASGRPMDRLVVGDVGYGKTEVALRAAAMAVLAGKQVALVAPTTVLVRQHIETFRRRFGRLGIEVAGLSRLSSAAEARQVKEGLADGSVRVVVGTQMVAGSGVAFAELGLVIIDEEQRFGAADKAKLRSLGEDVHVLTLTATPIPRTLQSALVGLQDLSLITTPPARRLPTQTRVSTFEAATIRTALLREKRRGGQSFLVVPRIEDMEPMAEQLKQIVPQLRMRQAHGKMPAAEIDEEMVGFANGEGDVLLATNIIEAGLDIPRANTMLVWHADLFGLAQLHQLRGRVGRGKARGYLHLLTEEGVELAPATLKRLRTMEALDQLGAGFAISARDLDLRGAGDLLGEEQAGHMKLIGIGLYQHLLERAIRASKGEDVDDWVPELHLEAHGRLPADWIPEDEVRINLYARIARLDSTDAVDALAGELEDRFGTLPEDVQTLLAVAGIRQLARETGIARVDAGPGGIAFTPRGKLPKKAPKGLEIKGERLLAKVATEAGPERLAKVRQLLESLA